MAVDSRQDQSSLEERVYPLDFTNALLTGVTVDDLAITHTPPSGSAVVPTYSVSSPLVYVNIPSGLVVGVHYFSCVAETSNADLSPEIRLLITVNY